MTARRQPSLWPGCEVKYDHLVDDRREAAHLFVGRNAAPRGSVLRIVKRQRYEAWEFEANGQPGRHGPCGATTENDVSSHSLTRCRLLRRRRMRDMDINGV
jgi:hypothetical protein